MFAVVRAAKIHLFVETLVGLILPLKWRLFPTIQKLKCQASNQLPVFDSVN